MRSVFDSSIWIELFREGAFFLCELTFTCFDFSSLGFMETLELSPVLWDVEFAVVSSFAVCSEQFF
jgi:hypothetical protein